MKLFLIRRQFIAEFDKGVLHKNIIHPFLTFDCWYDSGYDAVKNPTNGDLEVYCYANDVSDEVLRHDVNTILMSHSYEAVMIINAESGEPRSLIEVDAGSVFSEQKAVGDYEEGVKNICSGILRMNIQKKLLNPSVLRQ